MVFVDQAHVGGHRLRGLVRVHVVVVFVVLDGILVLGRVDILFIVQLIVLLLDDVLMLGSVMEIMVGCFVSGSLGVPGARRHDGMGTPEKPEPEVNDILVNRKYMTYL